MAAKFRDIVIVGADERATTRDARGRGLFNVHFELSEQPPTEWVRFYHDEEGGNPDRRLRRGHIAGHHLVVQATEGRLQAALDRLKAIVERTNARYREHAERARQKGEAREQQKVEALRQLDFD